MDELLSTKEMGWLLGRSDGSIRRMIKDGEIEGVQIPGAYRVPREEALRLAREKIEADAGRKLSDRQLEKLIDEVIAKNSGQT